jgi:8-oxo-dGTP diphosphatase
MDVAVLRGLVLRAQAARLQVLAERAAALSGGPIVVATALHRAGALLVAQRTRPPSLAGRWELPGGRVEPGEAEPAAVHRECREELGVGVTVTGRLGTDLPIDAGVLRVYVAELDPDTSEPQPLEHAALRWVGPDALAELDWVAADRAVLADLENLIRTPVVARPEG